MEAGVWAADEAAAERAAAACAAAAARGELFLLLDFDRTTTKCFVSGGARGTSAHGVLESAHIFSEEYRAQTKALFDHFYPVEIDAKIAIEEKIPIMREWYSQVHELMIHQEVTRGSITTAVADCQTIEFREGMPDIIKRCQEATPPVPVLIMSAGLGDVIEEFMLQRLPFRVEPTTMVISNKMVFDEGGALAGFSEPLLHMFNKTAAWMPEAGRKLVEGKRHCLLMGDGIGDVTMADGLEVERLKIGFLNEKVEDRLAQFQEHFDVVATGDGQVPSICFRAIGAGAQASSTL